MEPSTTVLINTAVIAAMGVYIAYLLRKARSDSGAPTSEIVAENKKLRAELDQERADRAREKRECDDLLARDEARLAAKQRTIDVLTLTAAIIAERGAKAAPMTGPQLPPVIVAAKQRTTSMVGVWADVASLAKLDLRADLEAVLDSGGFWKYRPLHGRVTGEMLQEELLTNGNADILYIAAHADDDGVYFADAKYPPTWIAETARTYGIKLVFLNACRTRSTAYAIRRFGVQSVVYTLDTLDDKVAIKFAKAFFDALSRGEAVTESCAHASRTARPPKATYESFGEWAVPTVEISG